MKTKIIYISGNDKFNTGDIRAAFDEIRAALNLGDDTVLFGVPVDTDDTLNNKFQDIKPVEIEPTIINTPEPEPVSEEVPEESVKPEVKKRGRKKTVVPQEETEKEETEQINNDDDSDEKVIPILSVLGNNETVEDAPETTEPVQESSITINQTVTSEDGIITEANTITVQEIISTPQEPTEIVNTEKTLEELLESMKPLQEDSELDNPDTDSDDDNTQDSTEPITDTPEPDMEDITLQQLATEFIENQDKIVNTTKPSVRGKIGKLKNILPFKKQKHEDNGLMGDLFGWAGVAANDEDFAMPGFFTGATKK